MGRALFMSVGVVAAVLATGGSALAAPRQE